MRKFKALLLSITLCFLMTPAHAMDVTLQWNAVTSPDIAGYRVYYDLDSGPPYQGQGALEGDSYVDVVPSLDEDPAPELVEFTLHGLEDGQLYFFSVAAYDTEYLESAFSDEVNNDSNGDGIADDIVHIVSTSYDETADEFLVIATSSDQPLVTLEAEGFGLLYWKSLKNYYRRNFSGVTELPATLIVRSSGGGWAEESFFKDVVNIESLNYNRTNQSLMVTATSSDQPDAKLTALGYGPVPWRSELDFYRRSFSGVSEPPTSVTVTSSRGGQATKSLALDVVNIELLKYDRTNNSLVVTATSSDQPDAKLTVEGFGSLPWKSWLDLYKNTFFGVSEPPPSVTVTSSRGGQATKSLSQDVVTIELLKYDQTNNSLIVTATSSDQPEAKLTAEGFGSLAWKSQKNFYRNTFFGVSERPSSVSVTSSRGGEDSKEMP